MNRLALLSLFFSLVAAPLAATGSRQATAVVLVRHAEKTASEGDPDLSAAGKARAAELARVLKDLRFDAILTSPMKRTKQTADPVATRLAKPVTPVALGNDHVKRVAEEIRKREGETLLVVGHSNTVPEIIRELGGPAVHVSDSDYDKMFVCTVPTREPARCVVLRYGKP